MQQDGERLAGLPPVRAVPAEEVRAALAGTPTVVVLDDDPTGTQTVRDLPVLTRWSPDDVDWALAQGAPAFFVLTNTRSLAPDDAAARTREVVRTCLDVARRRGVEVIVASRSDSTLRGHFPLETDVIAAEVGADAVVLAPAFPDAGRVTLDGVHWLRDGDSADPGGRERVRRRRHLRLPPLPPRRLGRGEERRGDPGRRRRRGRHRRACAPVR